LKLEDFNGNLITNLISNVIIDIDARVIEYPLLDGSYHVQTVGTPIRIADINCDISETGRDILLNSYAIGGKLRLEWYGKYYIGLIKGKPKWSILIKGNNDKRRYLTQLQIAISEEGSI
jgi:hypothetical protein